jgi:hypothetical protein
MPDITILKNSKIIIGDFVRLILISENLVEYKINNIINML